MREKNSFLVDDNASMERRRREAEQEHERRFARVHAREHDEERKNQGPEEALDNGMRQHPYLNSQHFDGIDPSVNPLPELNDEARTEHENAQRLQHQKKLEKNLNPSYNPSFNPTPRGP